MLISSEFFDGRKGEKDIILEEVVWFFEDAWKKGDPPVLEDYLPSSREVRLETLKELVCVDLERRLKSGEHCRVERYLERFPEIAGDPDHVFSLIVLEYQFRKRGDPALTTEEFCRRFPQFAEQMGAGMEC